MDQNQLSNHNRLAWEDDAYKAWVQHYGDPKAAATAIQADPSYTARRILPYLGDPVGLDIANPLGSHGRVATALSLLGANVSVFDISRSNAKYGSELAQAVGVDLKYVVGDFAAQAPLYANKFDAAVMELGILHYFVSLESFVDALAQITKPSGVVVLVDFHPLLKKSITIPSDDELVLKGDYFSSEVETAATPYDVFLEQEVPACLVRRWNMSEIINAFLGSKLSLVHFQEHPSLHCKQLPGTFTLVAKRTA